MVLILLVITISTKNLCMLHHRVQAFATGTPRVYECGGDVASVECTAAVPPSSRRLRRPLRKLFLNTAPP